MVATEQLADIFTKALVKKPLEYLRGKIMVWPEMLSNGTMKDKNLSKIQKSHDRLLNKRSKKSQILVGTHGLSPGVFTPIKRLKMRHIIVHEGVLNHVNLNTNRLRTLINIMLIMT